MTIEIPLTKGLVAIVDDEDAIVATRGWCVNNGYACRGRRIVDGPGSPKIYLHNEILGERPFPDARPDHINGNKLDNRRSNLRWGTIRQNAANSAPRPSKSGYRGVYPTKGGKFQARISTSIGTYDSAEEAAHAYDDALAAIHGEFARMNFP
jgi:hypothetical protein